MSARSAVNAAELAHNNGFPTWAIILIGVFVFVVGCACVLNVEYQRGRRLTAESVLDQEAVRFIEPEATQ